VVDKSEWCEKFEESKAVWEEQSQNSKQCEAGRDSKVQKRIGETSFEVQPSDVKKSHAFGIIVSRSY